MLIEDQDSNQPDDENIEVNYAEEEANPNLREESRTEIERLEKREKDKQVFLKELKEQNKAVEKSMDAVTSVRCGLVLNLN